MKEAMANLICSNYGSPIISGQILMEEHHIRIENALQKEKLTRE